MTELWQNWAALCISPWCTPETLQMHTGNLQLLLVKEVTSRQWTFIYLYNVLSTPWTVSDDATFSTYITAQQRYEKKLYQINCGSSYNWDLIKHLQIPLSSTGLAVEDNVHWRDTIQIRYCFPLPKNLTMHKFTLMKLPVTNCLVTTYPFKTFRHDNPTSLPFQKFDWWSFYNISFMIMLYYDGVGERESKRGVWRKTV